MSIASRLRENAAISAAAAKVLALKDHDPAFLASLEQDNALLTEAADALDRQADRLDTYRNALETVVKHSLLEIRRAAFAPEIGTRMTEPWRAAIADECRRLEDFARAALDMEQP